MEYQRLINELGKDIEEFYDWIKLEQEREESLIKRIIEEVSQSVEKVNENFFILIYGSYCFSAHLPTSDLNLMIHCGKETDYDPLDTLTKFRNIMDKKSYVINSEIKRYSNLMLRLELDDTMNYKKVEIIVVNCYHNIIEYNDNIKNTINKHSPFIKILLLMKYILKISNLDNYHNKGLTSYMMTHFLKLYFTEGDNTDKVLGSAFIKVLKFWKYPNSGYHVSKGMNI